MTAAAAVGNLHRVSGTSSEDPGIQKALATVGSLLTAGESIEAWAAQRRIFALKHRRLLLIATSGRFIALTRHLLGGYDSADIRWQDLKETRIRAGILGADLSLIAQSNSDLNIGAQVDRHWTYTGLNTDQAQALYRICQTHDQAWREKRRVRELEELRAKSGGLQFSPSIAADSEAESTRRLRQAREMLEAKLITDSEFESIKAKIVAGL